MTKFGAHIAFQNEDYQKSMNLYRRCREILPSNANLLLREVCESELRCLLKLERYKEAREIIIILVSRLHHKTLFGPIFKLVPTTICPLSEISLSPFLKKVEW